MRLGTAVVTLAVAIVCAPLSSDAQQPRRVPRIGYLSGASAASGTWGLDGFRQGLRELGWVEGRNIVIEYRWANGKPERLSEMAAELVRLKVDIIVTTATLTTQAAKQATRTIPIVMAISAYPVESRIITSLARPGGNITGVSVSPGLEIAGKRLELLKEVISKLSRVAVLCDFAIEPEVATFQVMQDAARVLGLTLVPLDVGSPQAFENALTAITRERTDGLFAFANDTNFTHRRRIVEFARKNGLPSMFEERNFVEDGGLMAYGPNFRDMFRRAATYVDRILKGARAADLPVEQPTTFELVVNARTAEALKLTIPRAIRLRANQMIE